jgi:hypothetical protein
MREIRASGSVEEVMSNRDPYSDFVSALLPRFIRTARRAKNNRNTCPKISSSASNAIASEKIIPPTTAMNVIAICMMSS